jgi:Xaa-Pro aminopeptidase
MNSRIDRLRAQFGPIGVDAFFISHPPHLRYLCGFSGSNGFGLVTPRQNILFTDGRYATQARKEAKGWTISITDTPFEEMGRRNLLRNGWRLGVDGNALPYATYLSLKKKFPDVAIVSKVGTIDRIAAVKDDSEIRMVKRAIAITDTVFAEILDVIRPGMTELDVAAEISYRQRRHGAEADAFEAIVASGPRGALPHGRASARKIKSGEFVTLDFGCVYRGYHSDLTRTVSVGRPNREWKKIYQTVHDAQSHAIDHARNGMMAKDLDAIARSHIKRAGYEKYFIHSLGHGLGLQIHEPPRISSRSLTRLQAGNVVTIEPGIYIPETGGVRIEDDILIENGHCTVLTRSRKDLVIL